MKTANILLILIVLVAIASTGCATRLTVNKPYAEVRTALQSLEQKFNAGLPTLREWQTTNHPPSVHLTQLAPATNSAVIFRAGNTTNEVFGYINPSPNTSRWESGLGTPVRSKVKFGPAFINENDHEPSCTLIISEHQTGGHFGNISSAIMAKPVGAQSTKVTFSTKKSGLFSNSRVREIEKQRRQELQQILDTAAQNLIPKNNN